MAPPSAQYALREARRLAANVRASIEGGTARPFHWRNLGGLCALGRYRGVAKVMGVKVRGFPAWFLHRTYHLAQMPTIGRKVRIMLDWTVALFFPRDLTQLGSLEHPREPFERAIGE